MRRLSVLLALISLTACGGRFSDVNEGDSGVGDDGGVIEDGGTQPDGGSCPANGPCAPGETRCKIDDCNTCACADGAWACTTLFCAVDAGPPVCPSAPPNANSTCADEGMSCGWASPGGCGGESCTCTNHRWACDVGDCPPPPPPSMCPATPPNQYASCDVIGTQCSYGDACTGTTCDCVMTYYGGAFECTSYGCADAGPPIDAGAH